MLSAKCRDPDGIIAMFVSYQFLFPHAVTPKRVTVPTGRQLFCSRYMVDDPTSTFTTKRVTVPPCVQFFSDLQSVIRSQLSVLQLMYIVQYIYLKKQALKALGSFIY